MPFAPALCFPPAVQRMFRVEHMNHRMVIVIASEEPYVINRTHHMARARMSHEHPARAPVYAREPHDLQTAQRAPPIYPIRLYIYAIYIITMYKSLLYLLCPAHRIYIRTAHICTCT